MTPGKVSLRRSVAFLFPCAKVFIPVLMLIIAYSSMVLWYESCNVGQKLADANGLMTSSLVMGVLLALRTNSAYDRWWEARKLWGQLVNDSRNLSIKLQTFVQDFHEKETLCRHLIAFGWSLKNHLRGDSNDVRLAALGFRDPNVKHWPLRISSSLYARLFALREAGVLSEMQLLLLDPHCKAFMDICGSCERILRSPIAPSYKNMIWLGLGIYIMALPWMLADSLGVWTIAAVGIGAYFSVGMELLAEEVENPFGTDANDLALGVLCRTIEESVQVALEVSISGTLPDSQYATFY